MNGGIGDGSMAVNSIEISAGGRWVRVPALDFRGRSITIKGGLVKLAAIHDEWWLESEIENPEICIKLLKEQKSRKLRADVFTFSQKMPGSAPKYPYASEPESVAAARVANFKEWWEKLPQESRKNVRRSQKRGVEIRTLEFGDQLIEDPKTKIHRVTIKDPAAPDPLQTRIIQLAYATPSNIVASVQGALTDKRSKVMGDTRTSQLVVVATEKEMTEVDELVKRLDTPTKQVLIEARLLETSLNPETTKGIDWSGTLQAQNVRFGNNLQANPPNSSVNQTLSSSLPKMLFDTAKGFNPATAFLDADGVNAVFSFLNKNAEAKVISAPRTVTLDNEPARIEVTRASPIINVTPGTVQVSGGSQITYTNLGIILNVTPRISANNYVNLKVSPEVSRIFDTVTRSVGAAGVFQADEYDIRKMESRVMIPSGNTLVLGGLVQDDVRHSNTKVPLLGDLPLMGGLFRSDSKKRQKSNLIIFITPTIVEDSDFQPTKSDFLKIPAPASDSVDGDWSAWDSGKPMDWSKPAYEKDAQRDSTK